LDLYNLSFIAEHSAVVQTLRTSDKKPVSVNESTVILYENQ